MGKIVLAAIALLIVMTVQTADQVTIDRYNKSGAICHSNGAAAAPKLADSADWKGRLERGRA